MCPYQKLPSYVIVIMIAKNRRLQCKPQPKLGDTDPILWDKQIDTFGNRICLIHANNNCKTKLSCTIHNETEFCRVVIAQWKQYISITATVKDAVQPSRSS